MIDSIAVVIGQQARTNGTANVSSPVVVQEGNVSMNNFNNSSNNNISNNDGEENISPSNNSIVSLGLRAHGVYPLSLLDSSFNASTISSENHENINHIERKRPRMEVNKVDYKRKIARSNEQVDVSTNIPTTTTKMSKEIVDIEKKPDGNVDTTSTRSGMIDGGETTIQEDSRTCDKKVEDLQADPRKRFKGRLLNDKKGKDTTSGHHLKTQTADDREKMANTKPYCTAPFFPLFTSIVGNSRSETGYEKGTEFREIGENGSTKRKLAKMTTSTVSRKVKEKRAQLVTNAIVRERRHRKAKDIANNRILGCPIVKPENSYRIDSITDCDDVEVSIADSRQTGAELGLYLTRGPAEDGSAPAGTILATYEGITFTTEEEIATVAADTYKSDYLWGGVNPFTNIYTIVDASDTHSCYTRYVDEGFDDNNTEVVFGEDGILYLQAAVDIELYSELLLGYGGPYWTEPERWNKLTKELQDKILRYYGGPPPEPRVRQDGVSDQRKVGTPIVNREGTERDQDSRNLRTGTTMIKQQLQQCYGKSSTDRSRISLGQYELRESQLDMIVSNLQHSTRDEATAQLRNAILDQNIRLQYWKLSDRQHWSDSEPDGACGWYAIAQAHMRQSEGNIFNVKTKEGMQQAVATLNSIADTNPPCTPEGRYRFEETVAWILRKAEGDNTPFTWDNRIATDDFAPFCHKINATLFTLPVIPPQIYMAVQRDAEGNETHWLPLDSSSRVHEGDLYISQPHLLQLEELVKGEAFAQIVQDHCWLFPALPLEPLHCKQAIEDLAGKCWDIIHGIRMIDDNSTTGNNRVRSTRRSRKVKRREEVRKHKLPAAVKAGQHKSPNRGAADINKRAPIEMIHLSDEEVALTLNRCYGTSVDKSSRISLGHINRPILTTIFNQLHQSTKENAHHIVRQALLDYCTETPLHYWKRPITALWSTSTPDGACGWYTMAQLRVRFQKLPPLDFSTEKDMKRGSEVLSQLVDEEVEDLTDVGMQSLRFVIQWMANPSREAFPAEHQLKSCDLTRLCPHCDIALFIKPGHQQEARSMHMPDRDQQWTPLVHHSMYPEATELIPLADLLYLTQTGEYAHLRDHHYWPYPASSTEEAQCRTALVDLANNLWSTAHRVAHNNMVQYPPTLRARGADKGTARSSDRPADKATQGTALIGEEGMHDNWGEGHNPTAEQEVQQGNNPTRKHDALEDMEKIYKEFDIRDHFIPENEDKTNTVDERTGVDGHIRIATLNVNGLTQMKLPLILIYLATKQIDVLMLQDTRLDDKGSRLITKLIKQHYEHMNIQVRFAAVSEAINQKDRVGGQMTIVAGRWASKVIKYFEDFTGTGLVTGTTLQAQEHQILLLSTYWPIKPLPNSDNNQLWNKVARHLKAHQVQQNPLEFIKHTIQERLKKHINGKPNNIALLVGDLNSTWGTTAAGGCHRGLESWAGSIAMSNPLHSLSLLQSNQLHTHWVGKHVGEGMEHLGRSWIDHILTHRNGKPVITRGGTEGGNEWIMISDHRPLWADIILPLGGVSPNLFLPQRLDPLRILDRTKTKSVEIFKEKIIKKINKLPTGLTPEDIMGKIATISVQSTPKPGKPNTSFYNSTRFKDGWSPMLVAKLAALTAITEMRQHITGEGKRHRWSHPDIIEKGIENITRTWESKLKKLTWDDKAAHEEAHSMAKGPTYWRLINRNEYHHLPTWLREMEKDTKSKMHGRQRSEDRRKMKNASADREKAVAAGKVGKALKSILGTHQATFDLHTLRLATGELVTDPIIIHNTQVQHWKEWFGETEETFFDQNTIDWNNPRALQEDFMKFKAHQNVPAELLQRIWNAIIQPTMDFPNIGRQLQNEVNQPITMDEVKAAIQKAPSGSVPGPSGLSYAMMKEWPEQALKLAHETMNTIWERKLIPESWNIKWLCPKPKVDPDKATLDDLRPLNLLETPRKILLGIIVGRITAIWEREGILSDSQYGFRPRRSCEGPTMQVLDAQEEAEESGTEIHGSSWDIRRAFDTVPKSVLVMSWERLGVPKEAAKYIVDLDRECLTVPLTPHAKYLQQTKGLSAFTTNPTSADNAQGFYGLTGCAQGDTPSPSNWTATFDIPLRALENCDPYPFMVRTEETIGNTQDLAFADDIFSISARREGLQAKADIISASVLVLGVRIAPAKLRTTAKAWGQEPSGYANDDYHLTVHGRDWVPLEVPVAYADTEDREKSFKYLGVHVDANNKYEKQYQMIKETTKQAAEAAMHKQASPETINMAIKLSTHRKVAFPGKFGSWTNQELRQLDVPLDQLYKHHLKFLPSTHSAAIYMDQDVGGMGITRMSDQINIDKWTMLMRGLHSDSQTSRAAQSLLQRSLRIGRTDTDMGYEAIAIFSFFLSTHSAAITWIKMLRYGITRMSIKLT